MFATTTDWSHSGWTDDMQELMDAKYLPMFKQFGALHYYYIATSDTTARSVTIWPDEATAMAAMDQLRGGASADTGATIVATAQGNVLGSM